MKNSIKITAIFAAILAILFIVPNASKATTREVTDESTLISEINSADPGDTISIQNNITITQVNVKAAESQIREVDFAEESATFNKWSILAQSGSYAMSQANAAQQNILRLLS